MTFLSVPARIMALVLALAAVTGAAHAMPDIPLLSFPTSHDGTADVTQNCTSLLRSCDAGS